MKKTNTQRLTRVGLFSTLALVTFLIENIFPPLLAFAPGTKIGIASIFVNLALIVYGEREALIVLSVKCFLGALFSGNMFSLYYSIPAGVSSLAVSILIYRLAVPKVSLVTMSICAAITHNIIQIFMVVILYNTPQMLYYIAVVSIAGFFAGVITGLALTFIIKVIPTRILRGDDYT